MFKRMSKDWWLWLLTLGLLAVGLNGLRRDQSKGNVVLKMTAGDANGLRHRLALDLAREAVSENVTIEVKPTSGSEAALAALNRGEFDIALVQGGLATNSLGPIKQVTALHIEPLHLLAKPEVVESIAKAGLNSLAGRRINLGSVGSGTNALASEVLTFAGLRGSGSQGPANFTPDTLSYAELMTRDFSDLPDALFTVSSLPSPIASFMIERHGYRLIPLTFGDALSLQAFLELGQPLQIGEIDKRHIYSSHIPNHTYSVRLAEPRQPLETIGTRLLLVAHQRVPGEVVKQLLDVLYNSSIARAERPALDATLLDLPPEYPAHAGAELYRQRNKPLIAGDAVDYLEKLLAILATVLGGMFFVIQWYLRSTQRKREVNLANYMKRVIAIECEITRNEASSNLDLPSLIRLQRELTEIKTDAVHRFASGELEGEALIQGFLSLINDARQQLTRLILHQRENIEHLSAEQHRSSEEIWHEQAIASGQDIHASGQVPVRCSSK